LTVLKPLAPLNIKGERKFGNSSRTFHGFFCESPHEVTKSLM